jgi:hypothetical protein
MALAAGLAACGSSSATGPKNLTPAQLATYYDSSWQADFAKHTLSDSAAGLYTVEFLELVSAFGGSRATVSVTTGSGTQSWYGFTYGVYAGADTGVVTVAYSDNNLTNFLVVESENENNSQFAEMFTGRFTAEAEDSVATVTSTLNSVGSSCSLQSGLVADTLYYNSIASDYTCQLANFTTSASVVFPAAADFGSLQTVSFSNLGTNGILLTETAGQHVTVGPTRIAGVMQRLRALARHGGLLPLVH